jgi:[ribosomal protein S5]-alanine N-acetyltransferase
VASVDAGRVRLQPLSAGALDALAAHDGPRFRAVTGLAVGDDVRPPPLMQDALAFVAEQVRSQPESADWWMWAVALDGRFAGTVGFAGAPDADGVVQVGYSVLPELQGRGLATDALRGIAAWAFGHPAVRRVRATIPPWNAPSIRVAEKAGFARSGTDRDDEVGEVLVFTLERS